MAKSAHTSGGSSPARVPPGTGYCPNHATGVKLPDGFVAMPLHYVD
jgi:hypothetical protein